MQKVFLSYRQNLLYTADLCPIFAVKIFLQRLSIIMKVLQSAEYNVQHVDVKNFVDE